MYLSVSWNTNVACWGTEAFKLGLLLLLLVLLCCAGAKSVRAARAAFRPQQGRRQMTVVAAADGADSGCFNCLKQLCMQLGQPGTFGNGLGHCLHTAVTVSGDLSTMSTAESLHPCSQ